MRRKLLKASNAALATALRDLEATRMIPKDDPVLSKLKADIRRTIERDPPAKTAPRITKAKTSRRSTS
jgi:hypothetical protein